MAAKAQPPTFKLAAVQMRCAPEPEVNLRRALEKVREAAGRGAQMIVLPELFRSQYFCQTETHENFDLAEPIPGPSTEALTAVARELKVVIVASLFERRAAGLYHNTAAIIDADGNIGGIFRKMHIPDDPLYYEKFYFTPGDLGFRAFDTGVGRIGTLVCWDQWYPEGARLTALADAWRTMQRAHAISNGVYVAAVNRGGHEGPADGGIEFWGGTFISDPFGVVLAEASRTEEETLIVTVDRKHQEPVRRRWPFLSARRVDAYGGITKRYLDL